MCCARRLGCPSEAKAALSPRDAASPCALSPLPHLRAGPQVIHRRAGELAPACRLCSKNQESLSMHYRLAAVLLPIGRRPSTQARAISGSIARAATRSKGDRAQSTSTALRTGVGRRAPRALPKKIAQSGSRARCQQRWTPLGHVPDAPCRVESGSAPLIPATTRGGSSELCAQARAGLWACARALGPLGPLGLHLEPEGSDRAPHATNTAAATTPTSPPFLLPTPLSHPPSIHPPPAHPTLHTPWAEKSSTSPVSWPPPCRVFRALTSTVGQGEQPQPRRIAHQHNN